MKSLNNTTKVIGVGIFAAVLAAGCAAKPLQGPTEVATPAPAPMPAPAMDHYTVVKGDHLWGISSMPKIYGNPYQWPLIYKANSDQIKDADLIYPGQVLAIDRAASDSEVQRAIMHAKTRGPWQLGVVEDSDTAYLAGK
jgi:hypothetical protein